MLMNLIFTLLLHNLILSDATLTPQNRKPKKTITKPAEVRLGPQNYSVFDINLIVDAPVPEDILNNHQAYYKDTKKLNTRSLVLGYVTPWNNHGYDIAKTFANKFTHISPVWLQVKRLYDNKYEVTGTHDVDKKWMKEVRKAGKERGTKIVPRILFENWTAKDFIDLVSKDKETIALADTLVQACETWNLDGLVIEIWSQLVGRIQNELLVRLLQEIAIKMKRKQYDMILVIPPRRSKDIIFGESQYADLYEYVTAFSLMTYDFSSVHRPGPNSPILWIEDCIKLLSPNPRKRDKILAGLNFYGYEYTPSGGGPLINRGYLKVLKNFKGPFQMDEKSLELFFEVKESDGKHVVFYPTLYTINERLELIKELGTGVSVWELGQDAQPGGRGEDSCMWPHNYHVRQNHLWFKMNWCGLQKKQVSFEYN